MTDLIHSVTLSLLRDMIQAMGFRASIATDPRGEEILQSATGGIGFEARLGNPSPDGDGRAADIRFVAAIRVEGALDLGIVNGWNNARRFGRLHLEGETLLLDMDVSVTGGVAPANLANQIEIWNRLIEALADYFRRGGSVAQGADVEPRSGHGRADAA